MKKESSDSFLLFPFLLAGIGSSPPGKRTRWRAAPDGCILYSITLNSLSARTRGSSLFFWPLLRDGAAGRCTFSIHAIVAQPHVPEPNICRARCHSIPDKSVIILKMQYVKGDKVSERTTEEERKREVEVQRHAKEPSRQSPPSQSQHLSQDRSTQLFRIPRKYSSCTRFH